MKTHIILTLALMCMAVTSCETELDINADISRQLCVFALATPGQELEVYVSSTQCIEDAKYISQKFSLDTYKKGSALKYYKQEYLVDNAQVILTVNNTTTIVLPYDSVTLSYHCGYTPTINDHLDLSVTAEDFEKATASTYIPTPQGISNIEFTTSYSLAVEASIRDYYDRTDPFNDYFGSDSIAIVKFGFHDPGRETNYYLLRPRSIAEIYNKPIPNRPVTVYSVSDVFFSEDPVFFDKQLKKGYNKGYDAIQEKLDDDYSDVEEDIEKIKKGYNKAKDIAKNVAEKINEERERQKILDNMKEGETTTLDNGVTVGKYGFGKYSKNAKSPAVRYIIK